MMRINCVVIVFPILLLSAILVSGKRKVQEAIVGSPATMKCKYNGITSSDVRVIVGLDKIPKSGKLERIGYIRENKLVKLRKGKGYDYLNEYKDNIQFIQLPDKTIKLVIKNTTLAQEGLTFSCQAFEENGMGNNIWTEETTLNIISPPEISITPPEEIQRTLNSEEDIVLKCTAKGKPKPKLRWTREGNDVDGTEPSGNNSLVLRLKANISLEYDGNYACNANVDSEKLRSTGQNEATQKVRVSVLYKPELKIERGTIYTDLNQKESITINVSGNPMPQLNCSVLRLPEPKRIRVTPYSTHHRLVYNVTILQVKQKDIGDYPCIATNSQGSANAKVRLTLKPSAPKVLSSDVSPYSDYYQLHWSVKSRAPMHNVTVEIHVRSKNVTKLVRTDTIKLSGNDRIFRNHIANLSENTMHELRIKACNSRGCGPQKVAYSFRTQQYDGTNTVDPNIVKVPVTIAPTRRGKVIEGPNNTAPTLHPFVGCLTVLSGILVAMAVH